MNEFMQWLTALSGRFYTAFIEGDRWKLYLQGLGITLEMTVFALIFGTILGVVVAVVRTAHDQQRPRQRNILLGILNVLCKIYTTVIRGTPMMVQILIWGFVIFASSRNKVLVGIIGLGINSGAYVAEIVRGGLMSVDVGQTEAGRPSLGNEFITLFKDTSLVNTIGAAELTYRAMRIGGANYDYMAPLIGSAIMYLIIVIVFTWAQGKLERRLRESDRR